MGEFFKSVWFKIILGVAAVLVGFILFEASTGNLSGPNGLLGMISQPFCQASEAITKAVGGFFDQIFNAGKYKEENQQLKDKISELESKMVDYDSMKTQNDQLKEVAGIKELHMDYELEPAGVVARDPDDTFGFMINRGSLHDVQVYDPVITSAGLVGYVSSVAPTYSHVTTILSPDLNVSGYETKTGAAGVVCGRADLAEKGQCQMLHLDKHTDITNGNLIATSGSSGIFPPDIVIGSVNEVNINENGMSSYLVIQPSVDIRGVTDVTVIKSFTGQGSQIPNS